MGPKVTRFQVGDRVDGLGLGMVTNRSAEGAFQEAYTILQTNMASELPSKISFESAAVLPLGLSTAAARLFQDTYLKLQYPTEPRRMSTDKTLLVWGGASSVGSNAIQLAVAAGYEVFTTASAGNFDHVLKLGAARVFDYRSTTVCDDLVML